MKFGHTSGWILIFTLIMMLMGCLEIESPSKNQRFVRGDIIAFGISGVTNTPKEVILKSDIELREWREASISGSATISVDTSNFHFVVGEITKHKFTIEAPGQSSDSVEIYIIPRCHEESDYVCQLPYYSECRSSICKVDTDSCQPTYPLLTCSDNDLDTFDFCQTNDYTGDEFCFNNETDYTINEHIVDGKTYHWFLGHDWQPGHWGEEHHIQWEPGATWISDLVYGTDLGISIEFNGLMRTYMGDSNVRPQTSDARFCDPGCNDPNACSFCNNAIVLSNDTDPSDGITLQQILFEYSANNEIQTVPIKVPGVHFDYYNPRIWGGSFNTITGIAANEERDTQKIVMFFATSSLSSLREGNHEIDGNPNTGVYGRSWLAWSDDGVNFTNCYEGEGDYLGLYYPFSESSIILDSEPPFTQEEDLLLTRGERHTGKFLQVSPVFIDDLGEIEGSCRPEVNGPGLLLYGTGVPYSYSNLYLAYIPLDQLCNKTAVRYFTGVNSGGCWSTNEIDAQPLFSEQVIQTFDYKPLEMGGDGTIDWCIPAGLSGGLRELSVKYVPEINGLVMLSNENWCPGYDDGYCDPFDEEIRSPISEVLFRSAPLARPWEWTTPRSTGTPGYGPYIIDRYTTYEAESQSLELYYMTSTWEGDSLDGHDPFNYKTPYGVESTSSIFSIAPY